MVHADMCDVIMSVGRLPPNYPYVEATLRLSDHEGLVLSEQRALSKQLHAAAADFAADGAVCAFDLINSCQAFLQERNVQAAARPDTAAVRPPRMQAEHPCGRTMRTSNSCATCLQIKVSFRGFHFTSAAGALVVAQHAAARGGCSRC